MIRRIHVVRREGWRGGRRQAEPRRRRHYRWHLEHQPRRAELARRPRPLGRDGHVQRRHHGHHPALGPPGVLAKRSRRLRDVERLLRWIADDQGLRPLLTEVDWRRRGLRRVSDHAAVGRAGLDQLPRLGVGAELGRCLCAALTTVSAAIVRGPGDPGPLGRWWSCGYRITGTACRARYQR